MIFMKLTTAVEADSRLTELLIDNDFLECVRASETTLTARETKQENTSITIGLFNHCLITIEA